MENIAKEMRELERSQSILSIQKAAIIELKKGNPDRDNSIFRKILKIIEDEE